MATGATGWCSCGGGGGGGRRGRCAQRRGLDATLLQAPSDAALPAADIYCLGGGEDGPQVRAARALSDDGSLVTRVRAGAVVLSVCAGFQGVGRSFPGPEGEGHEGIALLEVETVKGTGPRAVGEVLVEPTGLRDLPVLSGFENHGGRTTIIEGGETVPLGGGLAGVGKGSRDATAG